MNKSTRLMITAAALVGLYSGSLATRALAAEKGKADTAKADKGKHDCKGKNACKGKGGCSSAMDPKKDEKKKEKK